VHIAASSPFDRTLGQRGGPGSHVAVLADAKLQRLAARCEVTTDDHDDEAERRASQDTVELMAALRKQRPCVSKLQR
jgi:hypothetical protein